jgi:hypothetical protein
LPDGFADQGAKVAGARGFSGFARARFDAHVRGLVRNRCARPTYGACEFCIVRRGPTRCVQKGRILHVAYARARCVYREYAIEKRAQFDEFTSTDFHFCRLLARRGVVRRRAASAAKWLGIAISGCQRTCSVLIGSRHKKEQRTRRPLAQQPTIAQKLARFQQKSLPTWECAFRLFSGRLRLRAALCNEPFQKQLAPRR